MSKQRQQQLAATHEGELLPGVTVAILSNGSKVISGHSLSFTDIPTISYISFSGETITGYDLIPLIDIVAMPKPVTSSVNTDLSSFNKALKQALEYNPKGK